MDFYIFYIYCRYRSPWGRLRLKTNQNWGKWVLFSSLFQILSSSVLFMHTKTSMLTLTVYFERYILHFFSTCRNKIYFLIARIWLLIVLKILSRCTAKFFHPVRKKAKSPHFSRWKEIYYAWAQCLSSMIFKKQRLFSDIPDVNLKVLRLLRDGSIFFRK